MSYDSDNFSENQVVLGEPTLTTDDIIELYQNSEYIATISAEHVLETLQKILDDDLDDGVNIEDNGEEWIKAVALRIAAAVLREWLDESNN